jgi:hypothetical protein
MTPRRETLTPTPETGFEPVDVWAWSATAAKGHVLMYWRGNLAEACEREAEAEKKGATKRVARDVRRDAWNLYERGGAELYQRRAAPFVLEYLAERVR